MKRIAIILCLLALTWRAGLAGAQPAPDAVSPLPESLSDTGLYVAGSLRIHPDNLPYTPQYPLWSDGAVKRRWLYLPKGSAIDASDPDAWVFPPGTRLFKEFGYAKPVETRLIERLADGSWRYAAYVWNEDRTDATLAPERGYLRYAAAVAPGGIYTIPSRDDCRACHEGTAVPVLGIGTLQLSADRDPLAVNGEVKHVDDVDLTGLVARGLVTNLPRQYLDNPPRIAASSPTARAALGYLHGNCGHCHNDAGPLLDLDLVLAQRVADATASVLDVNRTLVHADSDFHLYGATQRVIPGQPSLSVLSLRMRSRNPIAQMPPLGTRAVDTNAMLLLERWIEEISLHEGDPHENL